MPPKRRASPIITEKIAADKGAIERGSHRERKRGVAMDCKSVA
jgi:hypothetical protein